MPDLDRAIALAPDYPPSYINRGNALLGLGRTDSAIFCYNEALSLDTASANAYGNRGLAFFRKGDPQRALADYNRALSLDSSLHHVVLNRALARNATGQYTLALGDLDSYLLSNAHDASALAARAWALFKLKRYEQAASDYQLLVARKTALPQEYSAMVNYFRKRGLRP